jgi:hypothetical protein
MVEIIGQVAGRPSIIEVRDLASNGTVRIYLCVHDEYHRSQRREWKRKLALSHPDFTGKDKLGREHWKKMNGSAFRKVKAEFDQWMEGEREWYDQFHLTPPNWG